MKQVYIFVMPIFSRLSSINVFAQESKPTQTNATSYKEYFGHEYNLKTEMINPHWLKNSLFNVTYRLDF